MRGLAIILVYKEYGNEGPFYGPFASFYREYVQQRLYMFDVQNQHLEKEVKKVLRISQTFFYYPRCFFVIVIYTLLLGL
jgi:hypothetical protein